MAGVGPTDLHDLALSLLDAAVGALNTIPEFDSTLDGAPSRAFVAPGPVVLDCCDQLTVHVQGIIEGESAPAQPRASISRINDVQLVITAARCIPVSAADGTPPPAADQQEAAEQINADQWALWNHIYNMVNAGVLFDKCCHVIWGALRALQPSGGCGGSTLTITVCLDGYPETIGG